VDCTAEPANGISRKNVPVAGRIAGPPGARFALVASITGILLVLNAQSIQIQMIAGCSTTSYRKSSDSYSDLTGRHVSAKSKRWEFRDMQRG
jgi:hypothetical protein